MKIESSHIGLGSQHAYSSRSSVEESLRAWVGRQRPDFEGHRSANGNTSLQSAMATISAAGRQASSDAQAAGAAQDAENQAGNDPKLQLLIGLLESLTGRKVKLFNAHDLKLDDAAQARLQQTAAAAQPARNQQQGWGGEYDRHEVRHESEQTAFSAQGVIKTSDGKEIRFDLSVEMKREFTQESNVSIRKGDGVKKDPLVINFSGTSAQLTDTKFSFDLDSDGKAEQMSFVGAGSGFLALDKNGNGTIDNGSELFGAQSGNGFADLSAYDSDGNQWLDENDAAYSKLRVWSRDAEGKDQLSTLAQRNVGALYLGNVATPFDLKNGANDLQGQVRSSGIYLHEDGRAGTLQQVDLVV